MLAPIRRIILTHFMSIIDSIFIDTPESTVEIPRKFRIPNPPIATVASRSDEVLIMANQRIQKMEVHRRKRIFKPSDPPDQNQNIQRRNEAHQKIVRK